MADENKPAANPPKVEPKKDAPTKPDEATANQVKLAGGEVGKKAPALGTDPRPEVEPIKAPTEQEVKDKVPKGKLGDGGPSSDAKGINQGNMREEKDQHPTENATAGGPDVGATPANAPGMSHS